MILGGLAAEHLAFGYSELLHSDVSKVSLCISGIAELQNQPFRFTYLKSRMVMHAWLLVIYVTKLINSWTEFLSG